MPEDHFIGLDVSARSVNLCAVDGDGKVVHEAKLSSQPDDIARHVLALPFTVARVGLEAGMLSQHIYGGLAEAGLAVVLRRNPPHESCPGGAVEQDRSA